MRFETLTIEKYGDVDSRTVTLAASPGLCVIYGPNEAGKSTGLAAISDFLFGIPHNSPHGQIFGYDQIRLTAALALSDGSRLTLRRRKGRAGRTLSDEKGQIVDEAVLTRYLGSTGRERFSSLFGLDHASLRTGGERLLAADGDIGRLIVEAGGGLRSLVEMIEALKRDGDALFSIRRSGERLFYKALDAYELADHAVRDGVMTRDAYEEARRGRELAEAVLVDLRGRQREIAEKSSRLQRLLRVIPTIRELDGVESDLASFDDLPALRGDFPDDVQAARKALDQAQNDLTEAETRRAALEAKIGGLSLPTSVLAVEAAIRDVQQKALYVSKAREDRPNRQTELDERLGKLESIRKVVGLAPDVEVESKLPPSDVITRVQILATEGIGRRVNIAAQVGQFEKARRALESVRERQTQRVRAGTHEPVGISATEFAQVPTLAGKVAAKVHQVEQTENRIAATVATLGFVDLDELQGFPCPDTAVIQSEIDRRTLLEAELARIEDKFATENAKRDSATAAIGRLTLAGEVPSAASIIHARQTRDASWGQIRERYLSTGGVAVASRALDDRRNDIGHHEQDTRMADELTDRKSLEADRVAALELTQRQYAEAIAVLTALEGQKTTLARRRTSMDAEWKSAWSVAAEKEVDLGRLKGLVDRRQECLEEAAGLEELRREVDELRADLAPCLFSLEQTEAKLAPGSANRTASLTQRVAMAAKAIKAHEDAYADYRQDENMSRELSLGVNDSEAMLTSLREEEARWRPSWCAALSKLGLSDDTEAERANEIATLWATASGLFDGIKLTRTRLFRMDEDEAALSLGVASLSANLDLALPADAVAAAAMLGVRLENALKVAIERESLSPQLREMTVERDAKANKLEHAKTVIGSLCSEAECTFEILVVLGERSRERDRCKDRKAMLLETIARSGDALPIETLRQQWAGRDIDVISAELTELRAEAGRIEPEIDNALSEVRKCGENLKRFSAADGINGSCLSSGGKVQMSSTGA